MLYTFFAKKRLLVVAAYLAFAISILWVLTYSFLPYGNQVMIAWSGKSQILPYRINHLYNSQTISNFLIKLKGISCDYPHLQYDEKLGFKYTENIGGAISILISEYDHHILTPVQKNFLLNHIYKTIEACNPNTAVDNVTPLRNAIFAKNESIVSAILKKGANPNLLYTKDDNSKSYTPLYFAEKILSSEKTEEGKQALTKIIELLKQAGAKSEMTEISTK
jgi:hypothetical protein